MKITGVLVDLLVDINPESYRPAMVLENRKKVLYVEVLKAIYGMLEAALLWYKTFKKDLADNGFIFNPYNPCVANKKVQGLQQTIVFHVDDLKSSHKSKSVNNKFEKWLNSMYGKTWKGYRNVWMSPRLPQDGIGLSKTRRTEDKDDEIRQEHAE
jgi:hypothetical protein